MDSLKPDTDVERDAEAQTVDPSARDALLAGSGEGGPDSKSASEEFEEDDNLGVPVDRGFGWVIAICAFLCTAITFGHNRSLSALFVDFSEEFSASTTMTSLTFTCYSFTGSVSTLVTCTILLGRIHARTICVLAGFFSASTTMAISQAPDIIVCIGLYAVKGVFFGALMVPPVSMIGYYFKKRRGIASAIASSGMVVAYIVFPPLASFFRVEYGLRGSLLIIGAIELNVVAFSLLLRPPSSYKKTYFLKRRGAIMKNLPKATNAEEGKQLIISTQSIDLSPRKKSDPDVVSSKFVSQNTNGRLPGVTRDRNSTSDTSVLPPNVEKIDTGASLITSGLPPIAKGGRGVPLNSNGAAADVERELSPTPNTNDMSPDAEERGTCVVSPDTNSLQFYTEERDRNVSQDTDDRPPQDAENKNRIVSLGTNGLPPDGKEEKNRTGSVGTNGILSSDVEEERNGAVLVGTNGLPPDVEEERNRTVSLGTNGQPPDAEERNRSVSVGTNGLPPDGEEERNRSVSVNTNTSLPPDANGLPLYPERRKNVSSSQDAGDQPEDDDKRGRAFSQGSLLGHPSHPNGYQAPAVVRGSCRDLVWQRWQQPAGRDAANLAAKTRLYHRSRSRSESVTSSTFMGASIAGSLLDVVPVGMVEMDEKNGIDFDEETASSSTKERRRGVSCSVHIDTSLFKLWTLRMFLVYISLSAGTNFILIYLPAIAFRSGISKPDAALLLTMAGCMDLVVRLVVGVIADKNWVSKETLVAASLTVIVAITQFVRYYTTYSLFVMFALLTGIFSGFRQNLLNPLLLDYFGADRAPRAMGLATMCVTLVVSVNHPILGLLVDKTGNFAASLHYVGGLVFLSILVLLTNPVVKRWDEEKRTAVADTAAEGKGGVKGTAS